MCMCAFRGVNLYIHVYVSLSMYIGAFVSVYVHVYVPLCVYVSVPPALFFETASFLGPGGSPFEVG